MSRTVILWADKLALSAGGGHPEQMLGAPDANCYGLSTGKSANADGISLSDLFWIIGIARYGYQR